MINIRIEFVNSPLNFSNLFRGETIWQAVLREREREECSPSRDPLTDRAIDCIFAGLRWNWVKWIGSILSGSS